MRTTKLIALTILLTVVFSNCDEDLLDENPPNIVTSNSLFVDYPGFEITLNGLYAQVRKEKETLSGSQSSMPMFSPGSTALSMQLT